MRLLSVSTFDTESRKLKKVLSQLFSIEDFKQIDKNIFFRVNEKSRSKIVTFLCH